MFRSLRLYLTTIHIIKQMRRDPELRAIILKNFQMDR